jgi:tetratricopeptide (TPR) repeat protein
LALAGAARGQASDATGAVRAPDMAESVLRSLDAAYLTDDERARLRVFHGVWTESDLQDPALRAAAALTLGVFDHPVFDDPAVPALDRAEAMAERGDLEGALALAAPGGEARAMRIRIGALMGLGRLDEARAEADAAVEAIGAGGNLRDAARITELVRILMMRADLRGEPASNYTDMVRMLATAHQELDRGYWPALLAEAELLVKKNSAKEGQEAALDVLRRNPMCARAWHLLGWWSVQTMSYDRARSIADRLDRLEQRMSSDPTVTSALGDLIRARADIRENDPDSARISLAPTLERYPSMRTAVAVRCAIDALSYDPEVFERSLAEFDALSPGSPEALYEAGAALAERRQYEMASDLLNRAVARQPNWPEPIIDLGLLEMQAGRDTEAKAALERATTLDPFNVRAKNSLALVNDVLAFETIETDNFLIRYKPGIDGVMAREMPALLEQMHEDVTTAMDFQPRTRTIMELMPDHASFAVRITGQSHIYTMAASTGPLMAMEAPKVGKGTTTIYDWLRVVRHEYTHTVTLAKTNNRIPMWFTEAAAVWMEHGPRDYDRCRLLADALANNALFDFPRLNLAFARPPERSQAYAQAHMIYEFILERWGPQAPLRMMEGYATGTREAAVMAEHLGVTPSELLDEFRAWAWKRVKAWGLAAEPSLDALRITETLADEELGAAFMRSVQDFALETGIRAVSGAFPARFEPALAEITPELIEFWHAMHPDHPDVVELVIALRLRDAGGEATEEIAPLLERYAELRPVDPMPHRQLARLYLRSDTPQRAVPHLEFLDAREVWSDTYAIELARLHAAAGRWDNATAKAERATHVSPFDPGNREVAAQVALGRRDFATAERHLLALVDLEPGQKRHVERLEALRRMSGG